MNYFRKLFIISFLTCSLISAQQNNEAMETLICNVEETTTAISNSGDFYELVIPVGFNDRLNNDGTLHWPTLVNNTDYPLQGVFPDGTLLRDYISNNSNVIPIEDWYEPMLDAFFDTHSNKYNASSQHTVDFDFIKKTDGTPYTPDNSMAYWISQNGTVGDKNVIWNKYQEILTEVIDNVYADNPSIINNADAIHFVFKVGSTAIRELHVDYGGWKADNITLGSHFTGPITINWKTDFIPHERLHLMGLPDRGYPKAGTWGYEQMDNRGVILSERSLYAQRPISSNDLINFGWIEADDILTVNSNNYESYGEIKLADLNYALSPIQKSNGFYRLVKVIVDPLINECFLIEFHNATEFDKNFSNYEEYSTHGYNKGILIWHKGISTIEEEESVTIVDLELAVPYNGWGGRTPIPNDNYPRGNYYRPFNHIDIYGNRDFDYLNDIGKDIDPDKPDGGKNIWSNTLDNCGVPSNCMDWLPRKNSKRSDFFTDEVIQGFVTNRITDATRPSTKAAGYLEEYFDPECSCFNQTIHYSYKTHIAITDMKRENDGNNDYMTIKVHYNYWEGTVEENETMSGNVIINGDLVVAENKTLTITAGTEIKFENNAKLIVEGNLICNGTSSNPILFTSIESNPSINDWKGIEVSGSSASVSLNYCTVKYANSGIKFMNSSTGTVSHSTFNDNYYGVYIHSSTPTIQYCTIEDNKYGIRFYNSYSPNWNQVHIKDNTVSNNSYYGFYVYNSDPTFKNNTVINNKRGVALWTGSNPILEGNTFQNSNYYGFACYGSASPNLNYNSSYTFGGYNTIISNGAKGARVTGSSNPNFGESSSSLGGYNSIYTNTSYEIENRTSNTVKAQKNWWGSASGPPSGAFYGSVLALNYLDYDPNGSQQRASSEPPVYVYDRDSDLPEDLQIANFEQNVADYKSSADKFKNHFTKNKDSKHNSLASVQYIKSLTHYLEPKAVVEEIEKTLTEKQTEIVRFELLSGDASQLSVIGNGKKAIKKLDEALKLKVEQEKKDRLSSQKAMIYVYDLNESEKGKSILEEILKSSSKESAWYELAENELNLLNRKNSLPKMNVESDEEVVPGEFDLIGNYPNPFNPSTTISYSLPSASNVKLEIFDVMGRMIKSYTTNSQSSGSHKVVWNGTNNNGVKVSTGIYIYRFEATSIETNEHFVKSEKLLLVK